MSRYDGLIIPRSYSEYINKTDAATLLQALQLSGVMDATPTANSNHPTQSGGVAAALSLLNTAIEQELKVTHFQKSFTVPAHSATTETQDVSETGYTPLFVICEDVADNLCNCYRCFLQSDGKKMYAVIQNNNNVQVTIKCKFAVLLKKN